MFEKDYLHGHASGYERRCELLSETLKEEKGADEKLTAIAKQGGAQAATSKK